MIRVTRLDGSQFFVNAEYLQTVESNPDTHLHLVNGHSYVVREPAEEIVERIIEYRRQTRGGGQPVLQLVRD